MNNAHGIKRTGPALARGPHLDAANEQMPHPARMARCYQDPDWSYRSKDETDVRITWKKAGWVPGRRIA